MFLAMFLLTSLVYAQNITITGNVKDDDGEPLIGATVVVKGNAQRGTITDVDGNYSIQASPNATLVFNYVGYISQETKIGNKTKIDIVMYQNKDRELQEVVVIGYGEVSKKDLTGSVVSVKMSDIKDVPVLSVDQALQGRVAGADIMATTGEPGAVTSIRIRGTRSITANNEPLIVVDGVMDAVSDLGDINSSDIESISILKDASSTAIYGSRGSNGVIIVTTKQGRKGKPDITFKADVGFSQLPRKLDIMDASEFAQYRNDYAYFATSDNYGEIGPETPQSEYPYPDPFKYGKGTDWIDEISQTAPYQNYNISLAGGSEKTTYYASFSYNDTRGIIERSGVKRYTGRLNLDHQLFKWMKVGFNGNYTFRDQDPNLVTIGGTNWWNAAIYLNPLLDAKSSFNNLWYSGQKYNSPRSYLDLVTRNQKSHNTNYSIYAEITPLKGLRFKTQGTYYKYERNIFQYEPGTMPAKAEDEGGTAYRGEYHKTNLLIENTLSYKTSFDKKHNIDVMGGLTSQRWEGNNLTLQGKGYQSDKIGWNDMGGIPDKENYTATSSFVDGGKTSLLTRLNYNFKEKYYITFTARADGGSNFADDHEWAFFPSGALKWNITGEDFMKNVKWIDEAAMRISMGRTGNDGISEYLSLDKLTSTTGGYLFGGKQPVAFYPSRMKNKKLTWEKTDVYNLAFDLSFFKNRLNITAEGYLSYTKDLLLNLQLPTQTGYNQTLKNIGETSNKGVELSIETKNIIGAKFSWLTSLTLSHNKQMVEDIGTSDFVKAYSAYGNNSYMMYGYVKGYPLNALWGFKYAGTWKNKDEIDRNKTTKAYISPTPALYDPGCARYLDVNHDGVMNENDLVYLGNADPWLHGGIQNTFHIFDFTLGVYFNYSLGGKIYNISEQWMGNGSPYTNQYRFMQNAWHPVRNPNSDIPRAGSNDGIASDRMVYDATYLRLKNISISYDFDLRRITNNVIRSLRVSASGENLYVWKKYNGFDPDVSSSSNNSTLRRVDIGAYPKPRTIIFSLQVKY
ncbi:TonB-dependent receptor [Dysgonomonas sp. 511]|nr:TonB-dependent receptor [Dysgonomonas sp. 511]